MPRFSRRAVCSPLTLASAIGLDGLRDGGNAVDAAVATSLALAVAYPHIVGGGGRPPRHGVGRGCARDPRADGIALGD